MGKCLLPISYYNRFKISFIMRKFECWIRSTDDEGVDLERGSHHPGSERSDLERVATKFGMIQWLFCVIVIRIRPV